MPDSMRDKRVVISSSLLVANHTRSQVTDFNDSTAAAHLVLALWWYQWWRQYPGRKSLLESWQDPTAGSYKKFQDPTGSYRIL